MIPQVELNKIEPQILEQKYIQFEDVYSMLEYIQQMSVIFEDNKKENIRLTIFPELNTIKQTIIHNNIWVADQSFSMN